VYQRTNPALPHAPENANANADLRLAVLREVAHPYDTRPRSEPESPRPVEEASVSEPDGSSKVMSNAKVLIPRITALSLERLENAISDLQGPRALPSPRRRPWRDPPVRPQ
jgi:hypothetical protein